MTLRLPSHWLDRVPALRQAWSQVGTYWEKLAERERRMVAFAALVLGGALLWFVLINPALKKISESRSQLAAMDAQWTQMQDDASKARALRQASPVSPPEAEAALRAATDRLGKDARLTVQGDRATLNFTGLQGAALASWLGEVRSGARARATEASLARSGTSYSGSVVLALPPR